MNTEKKNPYIANNIKVLRKKAGMKQHEFADLLNTSRGVIGSYEEGRSDPPLHMLIKIADWCDVTVDDLVRGNIC